MTKSNQNLTKIEPKATKPKVGVGSTSKTGRKRITKEQRNADGTFKKGNAGGGRKPECMSARMQARIMVQNKPELLEKALKNLFETSRRGG